MSLSRCGHGSFEPHATRVASVSSVPPRGCPRVLSACNSGPVRPLWLPTRARSCASSHTSNGAASTLPRPKIHAHGQHGPLLCQPRFSSADGRHRTRAGQAHAHESLAAPLPCTPRSPVLHSLAFSARLRLRRMSDVARWGQRQRFRTAQRNFGSTPSSQSVYLDTLGCDMYERKDKSWGPAPYGDRRSSRYRPTTHHHARS
jgi:hypothetical protein